MTAPQILALVSGATVSISIIVLLVTGGWRLGKLFEKVDNVDAAIKDVAADVKGMRTDLQQTNQYLMALANHHHNDVDGNTTFNVPFSPS